VKKYLDVWELGKTYPTPAAPLVVLENFNLALDQGEFVTLIGHSGCGKSTVLSIVAGLNDATAGTIILGGKEVTGPGPDRGVVFQSPCLLHWLTAIDNVLLGVDQVFSEGSTNERREIASRYLELVGLEDSLHKKPAELSAGMRQRVGLARAFALSPKLLLLDEPFGMLDALTRFELQETLLELWAKDQKTALMVTHDVDEALFLSDRIVMMTTGPRARVGEVMEVPFARPRRRSDVLEHPQYYQLRERLIGFLESQARTESMAPAAESQPAGLRRALLGATAWMRRGRLSAPPAPTPSTDSP
jgi:nitrate/nitrite transport system ATP-binding protein